MHRENASGIIRDYDIIIDGCDNFPTRYLVSDICEAYGKLMAAGVKVQEFKGEAANISLMTSDDPKVVKQIHEMADRTIKEHKMLMEHKGQEKNTSTKIKK